MSEGRQRNTSPERIVDVTCTFIFSRYLKMALEILSMLVILYNYFVFQISKYGGRCQRNQLTRYRVHVYYYLAIAFHIFTNGDCRKRNLSQVSRVDDSFNNIFIFRYLKMARKRQWNLLPGLCVGRCDCFPDI